jgi:hypothetical protein
LTVEQPEDVLVDGATIDDVRRALKLMRLEERIYDAQQKFILKRFGRSASDLANYGWFADSDAAKGWVVVVTKVYGHGLLNSGGSLGGRITHDFQER